jgi:MoxR-like ATPase
VVIATQNDIETGQTYDLPMAELDRFTKKLRLGYPDEAAEIDLLDRASGRHPIESLSPVASVEDIQRARTTAANVDAREPIRSYVVRLAAYTRANAELGASPRAALTLLRAAQARAVLAGREYVVPDDVQIEAPSVLGHRIRTADRTDGEEIVREALSTVPVEP